VAGLLVATHSFFQSHRCSGITCAVSSPPPFAPSSTSTPCFFSPRGSQQVSLLVPRVPETLTPRSTLFTLFSAWIPIKVSPGPAV
jgi:hypothetical protein